MGVPIADAGLHSYTPVRVEKSDGSIPEVAVPLPGYAPGTWLSCRVLVNYLTAREPLQLVESAVYNHDSLANNSEMQALYSSNNTPTMIRGLVNKVDLRPNKATAASSTNASPHDGLELMEIRAFIPVSKEHATDSEENTKNAEVLYYCLSSEVEWVGRASGGTVTIGEEVSFYPLALPDAVQRQE